MLDTLIILAAGKGTRLGELGQRSSKAMLQVAGKPLIYRVLETFDSIRLEKLVVVARPDDQALEKFALEFAKVKGLELKMVIQDKAVGAGDAILRAEPACQGTFFVSACDSITSPAHIDEMQKVHTSTTAEITLSLLDVSAEESIENRSVVLVQDQHVKKVIEKPGKNERLSNTIATPLYIFEASFFQHLRSHKPSKRGEIEILSAVQERIEAGALVKGVLTNIRHQVTTEEDLKTLSLQFS